MAENMREIKFRALNKNSKTFIYSDWKYGFVSFWDNVCNSTDFENPQQYTGLKDKNGKEIYEGDILESKEGVFTVEEWGDGVYRVVSQGMTWDWLHQLKSKGYLEHGKGNYEIIGNIYENSELVNQTT